MSCCDGESGPDHSDHSKQPDDPCCTIVELNLDQVVMGSRIFGPDVSTSIATPVELLSFEIDTPAPIVTIHAQAPPAGTKTHLRLCRLTI